MSPQTEIPSRSLQQRLSALETANEIRFRRAQLKRDLKAGRVSVVDEIEHVPQWLESMKVFDLLLALPKIGRVKANKLITSMRISPSKTLGGMSPRQRDALVVLLNSRP